MYAFEHSSKKRLMFRTFYEEEKNDTEIVIPFLGCVMVVIADYRLI